MDAAAALAVVLAATRDSVRTVDVARFAGLALLALGYSAVCSRVERNWFLLAVSPDKVYVDFYAVWTLAAAVLLPYSLTALLVAVVYIQAWIRAGAQPNDRPYPHRYLYTTAALLLTCRCVTAAVGPIDGGRGAGHAGVIAFVLGAGAPLYLVVNTAIVAAAVHLNSGSRKPETLFGSWSANGVEAGTLGLGAVTALSVLYAPWAAVLVLPAVFLLQHQALLRQLVAAATTDVKTELLNATAWRQVAQREVTRASQRGGSAAILVLDMDHFKCINDQHGHLAGDAALRSVGATLADELRGYDAVGRFGGEEFVAVLPDVGVAGAEHAAERLRRRIESLAVPLDGSPETLTVTASIGLALCPGHGDTLDDLLRAADDAMYEAKRAGRNTVRTAHLQPGCAPPCRSPQSRPSSAPEAAPEVTGR